MGRWFTAADIREARERIRGHVRVTPLEESIYLNDDEHHYYFKLESQQRGKSFKIRGALNTMAQLTPADCEFGVGTISTGNHGVAVSMAAHELGIDECIVVVPLGTPRAKTDRIRYFGARTMSLGKDYDEALTLGINYIDRTGMFYVDPFEHDARVYCGQGTIGLEILEQNPDIDTIVAPIGGGGLVSGIAVAAKSIKPDVRIVGVQTAACPAMVDSLHDGICYNRYPTEGDTVCEAIVGGIGQIAFETLPGLIDDIVVVSEKSIRAAFKFMIEREQCSVEAGSAMVVAAAREFPERVGGQDVALVISGGNLDVGILSSVLEEDFEA
ncbi:Pyridoxal-5'-phosphate-dependent protein beta subunit [Olsenella uli DSM 7084]|uniref:threonine ammonia-lyase n=1 Tax=Olsenella uli (strain ATCC 49627 / DSM 7084 / CCUG 31166 / CIP 109912 / JCM 12494 / LMG 11480 / NCIMB 702895 / VPI D76D-27C) TaxID=633147 RepID=E1QXU1_OLSUV|nr:threonine/serine dehydratase [Olsenella uli]ADK67205.1 Pyridoxal-5'-phosphate-dependent protein beta subunit [Olsenella uli DSM 7084]EUB30817.1 pyridoxal-phosphate dependent protein [Olsenella uli MSTE5]KRO12427.1 pyridoxal-5-phosphate-dependent protein subunit beta [Olsenella uli DSM 7084]MBS6418040.1 threonine/serine dehydratase [Olsenella uli]